MLAILTIALIDKKRYVVNDNINRLFENEKFQLYKDLEMDVNLLIMKINNKLKEISKGSSCDR